MNICLTLDYELYFGRQTGTAERCLLYPSNRFLDICDALNIRCTWFIDCGYLDKLNQLSADYPELKEEQRAVHAQIQRMVQSGHDCQLHIHPHWEDSGYNGSEWVMNTQRYKLSDFTTEEAAEIIFRYASALESVTGKPVSAYRAGGWCVQPFSQVRDAFMKKGIRIDSSVYKNGFYSSGHYKYDFRKAPNKTRWQFQEDECVETKNGFFTEIPISSVLLSPFFFWKLFLLGRLFPARHKPIGNGFPIPSPGKRRSYLTKWNEHPLFFEGYFVESLPGAVRAYISQNTGNELVALAHPKAFTEYSLDRLPDILGKLKKEHVFCTLSELQTDEH